MPAHQAAHGQSERDECVSRLGADGDSSLLRPSRRGFHELSHRLPLEPRAHSRQVVFLYVSSSRFIKVLNNSYYSSKYKRDSHYQAGYRTLPRAASEISEFLQDFSTDSRRYSIENKLSAYTTTAKLTLSNSSQEGRAATFASASKSSGLGSRSGGAPACPAPLPPTLRKAPAKETAIVLYDITLEINPNVLECKEGDRIVIEEDFGDWIRATMNGKEGFVPYNYIERVRN